MNRFLPSWLPRRISPPDDSMACEMDDPTVPYGLPQPWPHEAPAEPELSEVSDEEAGIAVLVCGLAGLVCAIDIVLRFCFST